MTIVADHVLETADAGFGDLIREQEAEKRALPAPFDERLVDQEPPRSDHERWLRARRLQLLPRGLQADRAAVGARPSPRALRPGRSVCATCLSEIGFTG